MNTQAAKHVHGDPNSTSYTTAGAAVIFFALNNAKHVFCVVDGCVETFKGVDGISSWMILHTHYVSIYRPDFKSCKKKVISCKKTSNTGTEFVPVFV